MCPETARSSSCLPIKRKWTGSMLLSPSRNLGTQSVGRWSAKWERRLQMRLWRLPVARAHTTGCRFLCRPGNVGLLVQCPQKTGLFEILSGPNTGPFEATGSKLPPSAPCGSPSPKTLP